MTKSTTGKGFSIGGVAAEPNWITTESVRSVTIDEIREDMKRDFEACQRTDAGVRAARRILDESPRSHYVIDDPAHAHVVFDVPAEYLGPTEVQVAVGDDGSAVVTMADGTSMTGQLVDADGERIEPGEGKGFAISAMIGLSEDGG
jgi:hypothetical protein